MNVLVLGGTRFVGRHIVEALLAASHDVSVLTRGKSKDDLPPQVERLCGDRDEGGAGLAALSGRYWDACVDVSGYTPRQVRASAALLHAYVRRYVFISAVSVYGDPVHRPVDETESTTVAATEDVSEVNGATYGPLKVACEEIVRAIYMEQCTLLRPQIVVGPHDVSGRYTYWVQRANMGGGMLAPGDGSDHVQFIDGRDLARFVVRVIENDLGGVFNLAGPRLTWAQFLLVLDAENPVWVPAGILKSAGLTFQELPLYRPDHGARSSLMDVNAERAMHAGLTLTPPTITAQDTKAWIESNNGGRLDLPAALSPAREAALVKVARAGCAK